MRHGQPPFSIEAGDSGLVATAIHAGHELRSEVDSLTALDEATRLREEDPFTDRFTDLGGTRLVCQRSRFEVDMNRPRNGAVYEGPDDAWGLEVWRRPLPREVIERSLDIYDDFYASYAGVLGRLVENGPVVVLDIHSYNHRRRGPSAPAEPAPDNPEVNVGTGSVDRDRWGDVVDRFVEDLALAGIAGRRLDVRENVRFKGGHLSRWTHDHYPRRVCVLAVELKKTFMDEWTGEVDVDHVDQLTAALRATVPGVLDAAGRTDR